MDLKSKLAAQANPAQPTPTTKVERKRIPMSAPTQRLSVPEIPGFHLHWFIGAPDRIQRALQGGYQFVEQIEVGLFDRDLAGGMGPSGGTDLGTRVSVIAGGTAENSNEAQRLYLMKLPDDLWAEDQAALAKINENLAQAIRGDGIAPAGQDNSNRYRGDDSKKRQTLFHPKH